MKKLIKVVIVENRYNKKNFTKLFKLDEYYIVEYKYTNMIESRKCKTKDEAFAECLFLKTALFILS